VSGNKIGGLKVAQTNKRKYGEDYYVNIGRIGGKASNTGGFASNKVGADGLTGKERARLAGAVGGSKSKRKTIKSVENEKKMVSKNAESVIKRIMSRFFTY
jgi:hypothetical protein